MRHYLYGNRKAWLCPRTCGSPEVAFDQAVTRNLHHNHKESLILYVYEDDELILTFDLNCNLRSGEKWFYEWREAILKKSRDVIKEHDENLLIRA